MPSPFPGMDPYLEEPDLWRDVHGNLVVAIQGALAAQVAPAYYVAIEEHTYIVSLDAPRALIRPDTAIVGDPASAAPSGGLAVATRASVTPRTVTLPQFEDLREPYLELRRTATHEVVTVVELLSPTNKGAGRGRDDYVEKRRRLLQTPSSLVEIDLLRAGEPMEMTPRPTEEYRVLVARPWERPAAQLWAFNVRDLLPEVPTPLRRGEPDAVIPLGKLLAEAYDRARYDLRLDYRQLPPAPPLTTEDAAWAEAVVTRPAATGQTVDVRRTRIDGASVPDENEGGS